MFRAIVKIRRKLDDKGLLKSHQSEVNEVITNSLNQIDYVNSVDVLEKPESHNAASNRAGHPTSGVEVTLDTQDSRINDRINNLTEELNSKIDEHQRSDGYKDTWTMRWYRTGDEDRFVVLAWYKEDMN